MTETKNTGDKTISVPKKPLGLKRPLERDTVRQSFSHGRTNMVQAMAAVEGCRTASPAASIFLLARDSSSELILQSMRAGANEFLTWPMDEQALEEAVERASARRGSTGGGGSL